MAWYTISVERNGQTFRFKQNHMQHHVTEARKGDAHYKRNVAHAAYVRWRRTPIGRRNDDGVAFTYDELQIDDYVIGSHSQQLDMFDSDDISDIE